MAGARGVVGQPLPRLDAVAKVTGTARYAADLQLPGMLHGRILRSPYAHARVTRLETRRAEALPGVVAVLSHVSLPGKSYRQSPYALTAADPVATPDQSLFDPVVRHAGQPVVAVAAVDVDTAMAALDLVEVAYEPGPVVTDPEAALRPGAPLVNEAWGSNLAGRLRYGTGDVDAGFREADIVLGRRFTTSRQKHVQTEPFACLADITADGVITVWTPSQTPHPLRGQLAALFGLPMSQVRVVTPAIGGAFGGRVGVVAEPYAVALALAARRPVRLEFSRAEDFVGTETRHPMMLDVRVGARRDGSLVAMQMTAYVNAGPYVTQSMDVTAVAGQLFLRPYHCPHRRFEGLVALTNAPVAGAYRGYGGPQVSWALEQMVDEVAERAGVDPLALRLRLARGVGDTDPLTGLEIRTSGLAECFRRGAAAIGWEARRGRRRRDGVWVHGVGAAMVAWNSGLGCMGAALVEAAGAAVRLNLDGTLDLATGSTDIGTGIATALRQIAAEELGVDPAGIRMVTGDTDVTPYDSGAHGSRSLFTGGHAVLRAVADARRQILQVASELLEAAPDDLHIVGGWVSPRGVPDRAVDLRAVALAAHRTRGEIRAQAGTVQANALSHGAHFVEVAVNTETGQVRIERYVAAHDVGRAINPLAVEGQIEGAVFHGIGYALSEDMVVDGETGAPLNATLMDYKVLSAADTPPIEVIILETPDPAGPVGAKGVGEVGLPPVAPAIANAIHDATGVRLADLPMTPPRVLRALRTRATR
jgi:xanthine dehydrogenase molybdenum-binding subunit